jgi:Peptidase M50B-like
MLSRIGEIQTPLSEPVALFIGILVFVVTLGPALWKITIHAETVVRESAHALVGLATGRRIRGVTINRNGGGATDMAPKSGFGYGVAAFVGYVGASAAGLIAAGLISVGHIVAVLWLGLLLIAVMLLMVRKFFACLHWNVCCEDLHRPDLLAWFRQLAAFLGHAYRVPG